jgi:hypothetical protein
LFKIISTCLRGAYSLRGEGIGTRWICGMILALKYIRRLFGFLTVRKVNGGERRKECSSSKSSICSRLRYEYTVRNLWRVGQCNAVDVCNFADYSEQFSKVGMKLIVGFLSGIFSPNRNDF